MNSISYDDYLRLCGLLKIAEDHRRIMDAVLKSALAITGEPDNLGHTADAIWDEQHTAKSLLDVLGIAIRPADTRVQIEP